MGSTVQASFRLATVKTFTVWRLGQRSKVKGHVGRQLMHVDLLKGGYAAYGFGILEIAPTRGVIGHPRAFRGSFSRQGSSVRLQHRGRTWAYGNGKCMEAYEVGARSPARSVSSLWFTSLAYGRPLPRVQA